MALSCSSLFWGTILIIWGISILIKALFGIDIPVLSTLLALGLLYLGFSLLTGNTACTVKRGGYTTHTNYSHYQESGFHKETIVFGEKTIDFTNMSPNQDTATQEYVITMASATFKINPAIPTSINVQTVMGRAQFPNNTEISVGSYHYTNSTEKPVLHIKATVVMGSLIVVEA